MRDLLIEIHTEEMPAKELMRLTNALAEEVAKRLQETNFSFDKVKQFATPRRLAIIMTELTSQQPDSVIERKGPALKAAFTSEGVPTKACEGFARSIGVQPTELITIQNDQGEWVGIQQKVSGKTLQTILPMIISDAIAALPIKKPMRWGDNTIEFIRPVHSVILLYGPQIIPAIILGLTTGNKTRGHRFYTKNWLTISLPSRYVALLKKNYVIVDFNERKKIIREQLVNLTQKELGNEYAVQMDEDLLNEVTGLIEWPVSLMGRFDKVFLDVPQEALISAMKNHQRYFPIVNTRGVLQPYFIIVSNIDSQDNKQIIQGNERVLRARLSDAQFFFNKDRTTIQKEGIDQYLQHLKKVTFQQQLGSLFDKAKRLQQLTGEIAAILQQDDKLASEAGLFAKMDLITELVGEFPELQGIAGFYYLQMLGISSHIGQAVRDQYRPAFAKDELPQTELGCLLSVADRLDTLVGAFGMGQLPTGDKDPLGLRRQAMGILRILIEKKIDIDLKNILEFASKNYTISFPNQNLIEDILNFMLERLRPWYQERGVTADVFAAVAALKIFRPFDFHQRIQAVQAFKQFPEASALSIANKRVSNILDKYSEKITAKDLNHNLFEEEVERELAEKAEEKYVKIKQLLILQHYTEMLAELATLREPLDRFFDKVMVMTEDKAKRENRLLLLKKLRELFLQVADIALLQ